MCGAARRIEHRVAGADANPYLAIAASLICGYVGMVERMVPPKMLEGNAYNRARTLPRTLEAALDRFYQCKPVKNLLLIDGKAVIPKPWSTLVAGNAQRDADTCRASARPARWIGPTNGWPRRRRCSAWACCNWRWPPRPAR